MLSLVESVGRYDPRVGHFKSRLVSCSKDKNSKTWIVKLTKFKFSRRFPMFAVLSLDSLVTVPYADENGLLIGAYDVVWGLATAKGFVAGVLGGWFCE